MNADRRCALAVALGSVLVSLPGLFWGLPAGKFLVGALVLLDGGALYRDHWTMYAPGSFYLIAGLLAAFGRQLIVPGVAALLVGGASAAAFFLMLRRLRTGTPPALALSAVFVGMLWTAAPTLHTYPPALLLLLLAVHRMLTAFRDGGGAPLLQAGLLCGVAAWFKHDIGAYGAAACGLAYVLAWLAAADRRPAAWLSPVPAVARVAAGAVLPVLVAAAVLGATAGDAAWRDLVVFPATVFSKVFGEPYPPVIPDFLGAMAAWARQPTSLEAGRAALGSASTWIICHVPSAVFLAGVAVIILRRRRLEIDTLAASILLLCLIPFFWQAAHVQQNTHVYSMAAFGLPLGAMAWGAVGRRPRAGLLLGCAVYALALWTMPGMNLLLALRDVPGSRTLGLPGTAGIRVSAAQYDVYRPITEWIRTHVPEDEPIYVGVQRHDAIVITDERFYYLTGRPGCSPYYELHPGVADDVEVQREIIRGIEEQGVRCVVLWRFGWPDATLDAIQAKRRAVRPGLGSTELNEFLAATFEPVSEHGEYVLLWRRGSPVPEATN